MDQGTGNDLCTMVSGTNRGGWLLLAITCLAVLSPCRSQDNGCVACHAEQARLEHERAHQRAGIGCADCHGGDPAATTATAAKAAGTGYRGVIARTDFPQLCGDCHADVRRMNPFGIPTDQLARYRTSRHGEALFESGDPDVATCVDCHGSHGVLGAASAESPVHPTKVAQTCAKCHADPALIAKHQLEGGEVDAWNDSVHAELLRKGDLSAPQCATCHGNHGAVPPGFAAVGAVCGKCHVREHELFEASPHARLVPAGEFEACVVCHGNHRVQPAGEHILRRVCALCHEDADDRGAAVRDRLLSLLGETQRDFDRAQGDLTAALARGLATEEDQLLLENARTALVEMRAVQHSLDPSALERAAHEAGTTLARVRERIDAAVTLESTKRFALLPVVAFLVLMSFGFFVRMRRIHVPHLEAAS